MLGGSLKSYVKLSSRVDISKFLLCTARRLSKDKTKKGSVGFSEVSNIEADTGDNSHHTDDDGSLSINVTQPAPQLDKKKKYRRKKKDKECENDIQTTATSDTSTSQSSQSTKSALDHFGNSLKRPGLQPISISKNKVKNTSTVLTSEEVSKSTDEDLNPFSLESVDLTQTIPKLRGPSVQHIRKLEIPSKWLLMDESFKPSTEFLNKILNYSIFGLEKPNSCCGNPEYVDCFVIGKKSTKVVPAVTTVLSKTLLPSQTFALKLWRQKSIAKLGQEGFAEYHREILTKGKEFHNTIQRYLTGEPIQSLNIENRPLIYNCWKSLVPFLNRIDDVIALESEVLHPELLYRGTVDCIIEIKGKPYIVEWKHSSRIRTKLSQNYDSPVQLMAYKGAINANTCYPFGVKSSLLVVAYNDGSPASVFHFPAKEHYASHWQYWLKRLHTYWNLQKVESELPRD